MTEVTDYMPPAPDGYAFRVFAPKWHERDLIPRWFRPLTVYLYENRGYFANANFYSTITPNATARNSAGSIRRAAQRALKKHYAEQRKKEERKAFRASPKGQASAAKQDLKDKKMLAKLRSKEAAKAAEYAAFVGDYPPKKLTDRK